MDSYPVEPVEDTPMGRSPSPAREAAAPPSDLPEERESARSTEQQPPRQREEVRRPAHAPTNPTPNNVLGVFGLSIRTTERDLDDEFGRHGRVEKVVIVYDQRSERSRGFGFVTMRDIDDAQRCIDALNGMDLHGRRLRVDFSATVKPHNPTPGQYMGEKRDEPPMRRNDDRWAGPRRDDRGGGGYGGDRGGDRFGGGDRFANGGGDRWGGGGGGGGGYGRDSRGGGRDDYRRDDRREDDRRDDRRGDDRRDDRRGDDRRDDRRSRSRSPRRRAYSRERSASPRRNDRQDGPPAPAREHIPEDAPLQY